MHDLSKSQKLLEKKVQFTLNRQNQSMMKQHVKSPNTWYIDCGVPRSELSEPIDL